VTFQATQDAAGQWSADQPLQVLQALAAQPELAEWNTRLSTAPLWTLLRLTPSPEARTLDFPSRHASAMRCWDAQGTRWARPTGPASRAACNRRVRASPWRCRPAPAPFCARRNRAARPASPPKRGRPRPGPSTSWPSSAKPVLLDGGILVLAVFILVAGLLNREQHYLIFASWLVVNLRMAALSAGWDHQWLGQQIPYDWLLVLRPLTLALYYTVTIVLFRTLFLETLQKLGHTRPINFIFYTTLPVLVLSLALPYESFLPVIWATTAVGVLIYIYLLGHMLIGAPSRMAVWYAASIGIALLASVYEVAAAALGLTALIGAVNSVTAALASTLLTALAVAERMRQEHQDKLVVQAELQNAFRVNPIGLFTLDAKGRFLSTNPALNDMLGPTLQQPGQDDWTHHFGAEAWRQLAQQTQRVGDAELPLTAPNLQDPNHPGTTWSRRRGPTGASKGRCRT
jgi:PAS domain-containing protein